MRVSADRLVSMDAIFSSAKTPIVPQLRSVLVSWTDDRSSSTVVLASSSRAVMAKQIRGVLCAAFVSHVIGSLGTQIIKPKTADRRCQGRTLSNRLRLGDPEQPSQHACIAASCRGLSLVGPWRYSPILWQGTGIRKAAIASEPTSFLAPQGQVYPPPRHG